MQFYQLFECQGQTSLFFVIKNIAYNFYTKCMKNLSCTYLLSSKCSCFIPVKYHEQLTSGF